MSGSKVIFDDTKKAELTSNLDHHHKPSMKSVDNILEKNAVKFVYKTVVEIRCKLGFFCVIKNNL